MPTIRETVEQSLLASGQGHYITYAQSVLTALENREREMTSKLLDAAEDYQDMDRADVYQVLCELGFVVPADPAKR